MIAYNITIAPKAGDLTAAEIAELPDAIRARLREVYVDRGEIRMDVIQVAPIACPACEQPISVTRDSMGIAVECGGEGEGACETSLTTGDETLALKIAAAQDHALTVFRAAEQQVRA
jgi:hypothetical protein